MTTINIPTSIEQAVDALVGVEALLRAKEWERAAIVAAFVEVSETQAHVSSDMRSSAQFAALGIAGLKSPNTVREYASRWLEQRDRPEPGQVIDLDGLPEWKKPDPGTRYAPGKDEAVRRIIEQPGTVQRALAENPEFAARVVTPEVAREVTGRTEPWNQTRPDDGERNREAAQQMQGIDRRHQESGVGDEDHMVKALFHIKALADRQVYDRLRVIDSSIHEALVGEQAADLTPEMFR